MGCNGSGASSMSKFKVGVETRSFHSWLVHVPFCRSEKSGPVLRYPVRRKLYSLSVSSRRPRKTKHYRRGSSSSISPSLFSFSHCSHHVFNRAIHSFTASQNISPTITSHHSAPPLCPRQVIIVIGCLGAKRRKAEYFVAVRGNSGAEVGWFRHRLHCWKQYQSCC